MAKSTAARRRVIQKRSAATTRRGNHAGDPDNPSGVSAALDKFTGEVGSKIDAISTSITGLADRIEVIEKRTADPEAPIPAIDELDKRMKAVEKRSAKLAEHDPEKRFQDLVDKGEHLSEVNERIDSLQAQLQRGSHRQPGPSVSEFRAAIANNDELQEWIDKGCKKNTSVQFDVPRLQRRAAGLVLGSTELGALSPDALRPGIISFLRDPVDFLDLVNTVPAIQADTYDYLRFTLESAGGHLVTKCKTLVDGDPTPKAEMEVDNVEGFFVGQTIKIWIAAGVETEVITAINTSTPSISVATDEYDYDIPVGTLVTSEQYAATAEEAQKPAGYLEAEELTVTLQTLAAYVILTRQRVRRTSVLNLAQYVEQELPRRQREVLEWHLINGDGAGGELDGFLNATGLATDLWSGLTVGDTRADLILWAAAQIPSSRQMTAVLHKLDWWEITNAKATDGHYINTPFGPATITDTPALKAIGSIRVVTSARIAQNTGLVLDLEAASEVVPGGDAEMQWGYINDQMIKNKITALYEESTAHAIKDETAFRKVDFTTPPS
jgi:HK97 family phage major capsid protein